MSAAFTLVPAAPSVEVFCRLRRQAGWGEMSEDIAARALDAGLMNATAYIDEAPVGFGRVVGDGVMYFYVCDMIVDERYRGMGIASALMTSLLAQIREAAPQGATIALMAAGGIESLYEKFGFMARPANGYGAGMTLFMDPIT